MKTDDFEIRLERQVMRPIPPVWRGEILEVARRAGGNPLSIITPQPASWWRGLLWPCPQAWAGLAAAWVMIFLLNLTSRDPVQVTKTSKDLPAPELLIALGEHRRLLSELIGTPSVVEPVKSLGPRPRSEIGHSTSSVRFA